MNFINRQKSKNNSQALDLTPIVDVVFNLLIFFALSLNFAASSGGIKIKLPKATTAEEIKPDQITIELTKDGKVYLNELPSTLKKIQKKLKSVSDKNSLVIIRADNSVEHGRVVEAMDLVKSQGFSRLAIAVDKSYDDL